MKARFFAIAALVLGLASCAKDFAPDANVAGGEVDYRLSVSAPELAMTRAAENGTNDDQNALDSAFGGVDYFQGTDWTTVDLRYTLEVYDADKDGNATSETPVKDRMVKVFDKYEQASFDLRLIQNRNYRFVVFADFVENGAATDAWSDAERLTKAGLNHSFPKTLKEITLINEDINEESADAYFAGKLIVPTNASKNEATIELTRPYAKVRVVATDLAELNNNSTPAKVTVEYRDYNANLFNAVTGKFDGKYETKSFTRSYTDPEASAYTAGYDAYTDKFLTVKGEEPRQTHKTLFTDYIPASDEQKTIQFQMSVYDEQQIIKTTNFNTDIPVQRNFLTTIIGNVLTTATEINVTIDDNFANADNQNWVFEAFVNGGVVTLDEDYEIGSTLYVEADAVLNLNGKTIKNAAGNQNTDVIVVKGNGKLTINGEGAIEAVTGNDGYAIIVRDNAELVINGGTYKSGVDENNEPNAVIYARDNGKVFVNGGTFPNDNNSKYVLNKRDADRINTTIEVRGGKFQNFNPANNAAEGAGTNFLAPGYGSFANGEWFEVVSMAIVHNADEFTAAAANAEIKAIRFANDINFGTSAAVVTTDKVILAEGYKLTAGGATTKNYGLRIDGDINVTVNDIVMKNCGGMYIINGAKVIVNNATMTPKYSGSGRNMFYVAAEGSELTVNSGEYRMGNTGIKYFAADGTAEKGYGKINVMGGKYYGTQANNQTTVYQPNGVNSVKIYGGEYYVYPSRAFDPTPYLADGYKTVETEANWVKVVAE